MAQTKNGITVDVLDTDLVRSKTLHEIIGFPEGAPASFDGNYDIVHPDDIERNIQAIKRCIIDEEHYSIQYRVHPS